MQSETLVRKIESLPPEAIAEIEDFVEFITLKTSRNAKKARYESIAEYAAEHSGSDVDLDEELGEAGLELLREETTQQKQTVDLYGAWRGKFPEDIDLDAELKEIRQAWEKEGNNA